MLRLTNKGFSLIETAIAAAVVIAIVIIGFALYTHDHSPQAIITNRQKSIDSYVKHLSLNNYSSFGTTLYSKNLITTNLFNTTKSLATSFTNGTLASNPAYALICVDTVPNNFTYGPVDLSSGGSKASLNVNVFEQGSLNSIPYTAYWVKSSSGWQLNNVSCH